MPNVPTPQPAASLRAARDAAALRYAELPALSLVYGQNIFFDATKAALPFHVEHPAVVPPTVSAPANVRVLSLAEALAETDLAADLARALTTASFTDDRAYQWMVSQLEDALVVSIPASARLAEPIVLVTDTTHEAAMQRVFVHAGAGSVAEVLDRRTGAHGFLGTLTDLIAEEGATLHVGITQTRGEASTHASFTRAFVAAGATVGVYNAHCGGAYVRSRAVGYLNAERAHFIADAGYAGNAAQLFDAYSESLHAAAHTTSRIRTALALSGTAKGIARALTRIDSSATGSDARQRIDALLLSERAEADTVPMLEIGTDDVSCSHAATTGQPDAALRFYLESRGLSPEEARRVIIDGHFGKLFTSLAEGPLRAALHETLTDRA